MRRAYVHHERRLLLCWAPKVGCTALANWFAYGLVGVTREDARNKARDWLHENGYRVDGRDVAVFRNAGYDVVAFKREPLLRAISAYVSKFVVRHRVPITAFGGLEEFAKSFYCAAKGVDAAAAEKTYSGLSFIEFLALIERRVTSRQPGNEPALDIHFNTQVPFYWRDIGPKVDEFFAFEDFADGIAALNRRAGISYVPGTINSTPYQLENRDVSDVSSLDLARSGQVPGPGGLINEKTIALSASAYAIDYETLGFAPFVLRKSSLPL